MVNSKAVSPLIGFILMLAIIMGFIGIVQSKWVPEWNKDVEGQHLDRLSYEFSKLSEALTMSSLSGSEAKVVIDAGVDYPKIPMLISPPPAPTTLRAVKLNVTVKTVVETKNFTTYAILAEPNYYYSMRPKLIYEHSAIFEMYNDAVIVKSDQMSFSEDKITLYIINATFQSFSTVQPVNIILKPVSYGGSTHYDYVNISFECVNEKTAEWWNSTLASMGFNVERDGNIVNTEASNIELSINYLVASASAAGEVRIQVSQTPVKLVNLSEKSYEVYKGVSIPLGVRVLDEFGNPVRRVEVQIEIEGGGSTEVTTKQSDDNGEVWYIFNAKSSGNYNVIFSIPGYEFTYRINVSAPPSGVGGIFDIAWNVSSPYEWNASEDGYFKNFEVEVTYDGNAVSNARVDFSTDNPSLISPSKNYEYTNSDGRAEVGVTALNNGTVNLFATCGGSAAVLQLDITGVTFCRGFSYWREITIQNRVGYELRDYQVKIEIDTQSLISDGKMRSDCGDIRFYDEGGQPLSYWVEEGTCNSPYTHIWVKIPNIPASGSTKIYMFYGNPSVSSESGGSATFDFFDDFTTWDGWNNWGDGRVEQSTYGGRDVLKKCDYCDPNGGWKSIGITVNNFRLLVKDLRGDEGSDCGYDRYGLENSAYNGYGIIREAYTIGSGVFGWEIREGGYSIYKRYIYAYQPYKNWYITELTRYGNKLTAKIYDESGDLIEDVTYSIPSSYRYYELDRVVVRGGRPYYIDWIAVAKYVSPEPSVYIGDENTC